MNYQNFIPFKTTALSKRQIYTLILFLALLLALPFIIYLVGRRQDIRPRASLAGVANFRLNADTTQVKAGDTVNVLVSLELTDPNVLVSGVDFSLLFDKAKLSFVSASQASGSPFTDVVIMPTSSQLYQNEGAGSFDYIRMAMVANSSDANLSGGTVPLANIVIQALSDGAGTIKFPDDNSKLQAVGTSL